MTPTLAADMMMIRADEVRVGDILYHGTWRDRVIALPEWSGRCGLIMCQRFTAVVWPSDVVTVRR